MVKNKPKTKKGRGQPTKYRENFPGKILKMGTGVTHADMSKNLGVSTSSFSDYLNDYPEFSAAVKEIDEHTTSIVESAFFKRATGYEFEEISSEAWDIEQEDHSVTSGKKIKRLRSRAKTTIKHIPPDVGAGKFWLINKGAGKWAERQEVKVEEVTVELIPDSEEDENALNE